jgi:hypothetical protein
MMELSYRRHRFPPVVIQHAVWLYLRLTLSYRDVEDLLVERGLDVSYETVRELGAEIRTSDRTAATAAASPAGRSRRAISRRRSVLFSRREQFLALAHLRQTDPAPQVGQRPESGRNPRKFHTAV